AFATVGRRWGALNALLCAAGPTSAGTLEELSDADWLHAFDEGVLGTVRCVRAALPLLRKARFARIVTLGATSTRHQNPRLIGYTAAKAALVSVSKNLARSLAPEAMVVNVAWPEPSRMPVPRVLDPSLKVTVPVGVPAPGLFAVTVAVKVTDCPDTDGLADELTNVVVPAFFTIWLSVVEMLPLKFASPP